MYLTMPSIIFSVSCSLSDHFTIATSVPRANWNAAWNWDWDWDHFHELALEYSIKCADNSVRLGDYRKAYFYIRRGQSMVRVQ